MEPKYIIKINGKSFSLEELFKDAIISDTTIHNLDLEFNSGDSNQSIDLLALLIVVQQIISRNKNASEYTLILGSLINSMIMVKKLETEAGLNDYRF